MRWYICSGSYNAWHTRSSDFKYVFSVLLQFNFIDCALKELLVASSNLVATDCVSTLGETLITTSVANIVLTLE